MEPTKKRKRKRKVDTTTHCLKCGMLLHVFHRYRGRERMVVPCKICLDQAKEERDIEISELKRKVARLEDDIEHNKIIQSEGEGKR